MSTRAERKLEERRKENYRRKQTTREDVAEILAAYHMQLSTDHIEPLENAVSFLLLPWYKRSWIKTRDKWAARWRAWKPRLRQLRYRTLPRWLSLVGGAGPSALGMVDEADPHGGAHGAPETP